ncbi:hypothetical protein SK128_027479 [Halocaridina rubra]|uniref:Uncharacterized protein n=1 Tax=Halocaridina rubra TaxID=373956 RepID=A0AAN9A291_HALRR
MCGLFAYHLWYKNYTIKAFLVSSVVCFVISILAIILIIYALVNRREHYYYIVQQAEKQPWYKPYNATTDSEHQLTVSVSANLLVGFIFEFLLAVWSVKIGWRGIRSEEFSSRSRDLLPDDLQSIVSTQHDGQRVPLAALYQLIQAHPELLGSKAIGNSLGSPWTMGIDDRPTHRSMDYQERVSRYLSHAIENQNPSISRSPSLIQGEPQGESHENPSSSEGRGSPSSSADTALMLPELKVSAVDESSTAVNKTKQNKPEIIEELANTHITKVRMKTGELKSKAPVPKDTNENKENVTKLVVRETDHNQIKSSSEISKEEENQKTKNKEKRSQANEDNKKITEEIETKRESQLTEKLTYQEENHRKKKKEKRTKEKAESSTSKINQDVLETAPVQEEIHHEKHLETKTSSGINNENHSQLLTKQVYGKDKEESISLQNERPQKHRKKNEKQSNTVENDKNPSQYLAEQANGKEEEENRSLHNEKSEKHKKKKNEKQDNVIENDKNTLQLKTEQKIEKEENGSKRLHNEVSNEKSEKQGKKKHEKKSNVVDEEPKNNMEYETARKEKKKHKKREKHEPSKTSTTTHEKQGATDTLVKISTQDKKQATETLLQIPARDKKEETDTSVQLSEACMNTTDISEVNKKSISIVDETLENANKNNITEQVISIKPPCEFQDNEAERK